LLHLSHIACCGAVSICHNLNVQTHTIRDIKGTNMHGRLNKNCILATYCSKSSIDFGRLSLAKLYLYKRIYIRKRLIRFNNTEMRGQLKMVIYGTSQLTEAIVIQLHWAPLYSRPVHTSNKVAENGNKLLPKLYRSIAENGNTVARNSDTLLPETATNYCRSYSRRKRQHIGLHVVVSLIVRTETATVAGAASDF